MDTSFNFNLITLIVDWGQFGGIVLGVVLGIYLDDCREIGRGHGGVSANSKPFDWVKSADVIYPVLLALVFAACGTWACQRVHALEEKLGQAELASVVEDATHLAPLQLPQLVKK